MKERRVGGTEVSRYEWSQLEASLVKYRLGIKIGIMFVQK